MVYKFPFCMSILTFVCGFFKHPSILFLYVCLYSDELNTVCSMTCIFVSFPQKRNGIVFSSGVNYLHSGGNIQLE